MFTTLTPSTTVHAHQPSPTTVGEQNGGQSDKGFGYGPAHRHRDQETDHAGPYVDGDGLILNVAAGGSKSWILRVRVEGGRRDIGLGSTKVPTLTEACNKARKYRRPIAQGIDPVAEK